MRTDRGLGKYYVGNRPSKWVLKDSNGFNRKKGEDGKEHPMKREHRCEEESIGLAGP